MHSKELKTIASAISVYLLGSLGGTDGWIQAFGIGEARQRILSNKGG